jgi:hypothetical protein
MGEEPIVRYPAVPSRKSQPWMTILDILRDLGREVLAEEDDAHDSIQSSSGSELDETSSVQ